MSGHGILLRQLGSRHLSDSRCCAVVSESSQVLTRHSSTLTALGWVWFPADLLWFGFTVKSNGGL